MSLSLPTARAVVEEGELRKPAQWSVQAAAEGVEESERNGLTQLQALPLLNHSVLARVEQQAQPGLRALMVELAARVVILRFLLG